MFNGVTPPWYRDLAIERTAFNCYAMECEGLLPTRQGKINKVIKILAGAGDPNDLSTQKYAFNQADLNIEDLTDEEIEYMEKEIRRRKWQ